MDLNWCVRLATLFLVCLLECRSQSAERCTDIDTVIRLTRTAVEVDWTITPDEGQQYRVAYGIGGDPLNQSSMPVHATSGSPLNTYRLFIDGLDPFVKYCFQVQVVDVYPSDCGEIHCINASTEMLPTKVPTNFTVVPGPTQVQFSWSVDSLVFVLLSCRTTENLIVLRTLDFTGSIQSELTGVQFTAYTEYICDISIVASAGVVGPSSTMRFRTLQDVPGTPPTNVTVVVVTTSPYRVRVTWSPPTAPNGNITHYRLSVTLNGSPFTSINVSAGSLTHDIDELTPFGNVTVTISASTIIGEGPSSTATLTTSQAVPGSPPTNVSIAEVSAYHVRVTWSPPTTPNGIITLYGLSATLNGSLFTSIILPAGSRTHIINGLTPFGNVTVTINASTIIGVGIENSTVELRTSEAVPGTPPTNVTIDVVTTSPYQVRVTWSPPTAPNGIITHYRLSVTLNGSPFTSINVSAGSLTHDIDELTPFGNVTVTISASTIIGEGPSSTATLTTSQAVPGSPPTNVSIAEVSAYHVRVTWSPPMTPNGIITLYGLSATLNGSLFTSIILPAGSRTHTINGLTPFGNVTVTINASTIIGVGLSSTLKLRTSEAAPSEVTNFLVSILSNTSLNISWGPPEHHNGELTHYAYTVSANSMILYPEQIINAKDSQTDYATTVDSLMPFVTYIVEVYAVNSAGGGAHKVYTRESVPNAPVITAATRRSSDSMRVNWTAENTGGFITRYTVEYEPSYTSTVDCQRQSVDVPLSEAVSRDSNTITINGLQSGYSYAVSVIAYNSIGILSPKSTPAIVGSFISGNTSYSDGTRRSVVQLRLSGVENCSTWIEENTSVDLVSAIAVRLSIICPTCGYTSVEWLMDSILQCTGREDQVLFRAVLSTAMCSGPTLSCSKHLEFWASLQDPFLRFGEQVLLVDSTCPLYTNSLTSDDCMDPSMRVEGTASQGGAIAGSFLGGVLAGFSFSLILIIAIYAYFQRTNRNAKSSENVESENPTMRYGRPKALSEEADPGYEPLPLRADWMWSGHPGTKNQTTSHYEDDDNEYEIPCIIDSPLPCGSLPNPKRVKAQKKLGSRDTVSKAESEKVPQNVRSTTTTVQKEQRVRAASYHSEQRPGRKTSLRLPGHRGDTGSEAESEKAQKHIKELSGVQKEQRVREASKPSEQRTPGRKMSLHLPGHRGDTGSEAESEKAPRRIKELRSTSAVQKEQRVQEASNPSEQRTPGPLHPPGQGGKPRPQPVSKSRQVQDGDKARGSPPIVQPKPKNKATGNITLHANAAYEKVTLA